MVPYMVFILIAVTRFTAYGECNECSVPIHVYDDLKCKPKYSDSNSCCPLEYDCSHIYNRPEGTCHFKGKYYKEGQKPYAEDVAGNCDHASCECGANGAFRCIIPSDSCAEFWVPGFIQPGCYLAYEQNRCCQKEQKCPPFNENDAKCKVGNETYKEGQRFAHPTKQCMNCICEKGFNGKFDAPVCQPWNCTTSLRNSDKIEKYCAPQYLNADDCCPRSWLCPSEKGSYIPASIPPTASTSKCKFGEKSMFVGEKYVYDRLTCECVVPPYLTCKPSHLV